MFALLLGPIVSLLVRLLSGIGFVKRFPKLTATILSAIASIVAVVSHGGLTGGVVDLLNQIAGQIGTIVAATAVTASAAIATHQVAIKPILGPIDPAKDVRTPPPPRNPLQN